MHDVMLVHTKTNRVIASNRRTEALASLKIVDLIFLLSSFKIFNQSIDQCQSINQSNKLYLKRG